MNRKVLFIIVPVALLLVAMGAFGHYIHGLNGDSFDLSDTEVRVVVSNSMDGEPRDEFDIETIPVGSMVFIEKVPEGPYAYDFYTSLEVGDVVTFHFKNPVTRENMVVTHRIIDISNHNGDIRFTMAGDAIKDDPTNSSVQVVDASSGDMIGKVTGVSPTLGSVMTYISSAEGKAVLIGAFAAIIATIWLAPLAFRLAISSERKRGE